MSFKFRDRITGLALLAVSASSVSTLGCRGRNASQPAAPSLLTYEQARMMVFNQEKAYAHGYASVGYAPDIMTIPGHPFTAQRTYAEWPEDGSPDAPVVTTTVTIARDSAGRIHYESSRRPGSIDVEISDPVHEVRYRYFIKPGLTGKLSAEECSQPLMRDITRQHGSLGSAPLPQGAVLEDVSYRPQTSQRYPQTKDQNDELGTRRIEGTLAYGGRTQHVVSNQFGRKPMVIERWFSPDLALNLWEVNDIAGQNQWSVRTHNILLSEPNASLFLPPPDYSLPAKIPSCIPLR